MMRKMQVSSGMFGLLFVVMVPVYAVPSQLNSVFAALKSGATGAHLVEKRVAAVHRVKAAQKKVKERAQEKADDFKQRVEAINRKAQVASAVLGDPQVTAVLKTAVKEEAECIKETCKHLKGFCKTWHGQRLVLTEAALGMPNYVVAPSTALQVMLDITAGLAKALFNIHTSGNVTSEKK